jgi:hypothetical protein
MTLKEATTQPTRAGRSTEASTMSKMAKTVTLVGPSGRKVVAKLWTGRTDYAITATKSFEYQVADFWLDDNGNDYKEIAGPHSESLTR